MFGNVVNSIGQPKDKSILSDIPSTEYAPIEYMKPRSILLPPYNRRMIYPLWTGTRVVDYQCMLELGRLSPPFVFRGPPGTQKTTVAIDAALYNVLENKKKPPEEKYKAVICLPDETELDEYVSLFKKHDCLQDVLFVTNDSDATSMARVLAPFTAATICHHLCSRGQKTIFILDAIQDHFSAYRTLQSTLELPLSSTQLYSNLFHRFEKMPCAVITTLDTPQVKPPLTEESQYQANLEVVMDQVTSTFVQFSPDEIYTPCVRWTVPTKKFIPHAPPYLMKLAFSLRLERAVALDCLDSLADSLQPSSKNRRIPDNLDLDPETTYILHTLMMLYLLFDQPPHTLSSCDKNFIKLFAVLRGYCDEIDLDDFDEYLEFVAETVHKKFPQLADQQEFFEKDAIREACAEAEKTFLHDKSKFHNKFAKWWKKSFSLTLK